MLLHYDDPLLRDLYFLDPQWLCDMLAHVVTVREVNPHINNGKWQLSENCLSPRFSVGSLLSNMIDVSWRHADVTFVMLVLMVIG